MPKELELQDVNYKVKCPECGKSARMTSLTRDKDGEGAVVECKHCEDGYVVPLKEVEKFESIGAAIRAARRA